MPSRPHLVALALAIAFPLAAQALGEGFSVGFATRVLIFARAAASLHFLVAFGGMASLGHATFLGAGAYAVGILMHHGIASAWIAWPAAILVAAFLAAVIGALSVRTRGVYFIMITLALAQTVHTLAVSLKAYGGDDGLPLASRSRIAAGVDLANDLVFYYVVLALLVAILVSLRRIVNARFGRALQAIRANESRMAAIGYPVHRFKVAAFIIAGAVAGLAGALLANQNGLVSPSLLHWPQSGALLVMVIVGGVGYFYGGVLGAVVLLVLEEILSAWTIHWAFAIGCFLLAVAIAAPRGIAGLVTRRRGDG